MQSDAKTPVVKRVPYRESVEEADTHEQIGKAASSRSIPVHPTRGEWRQSPRRDLRYTSSDPPLRARIVECRTSPRGFGSVTKRTIITSANRCPKGLVCCDLQPIQPVWAMRPADRPVGALLRQRLFSPVQLTGVLMSGMFQGSAAGNVHLARVSDQAWQEEDEVFPDGHDQQRQDQDKQER